MYTNRVIAFLSKNTGTTINRKTAGRIFRSKNQKLNSTQFNNSVMRGIRRMFEAGLLTRVSRGTYKLANTRVAVGK